PFLRRLPVWQASRPRERKGPRHQNLVLLVYVGGVIPAYKSRRVMGTRRDGERFDLSVNG
ncbi:MAG: hypothetical protein J2P36_33145, partial [Ktedonobacteraceae bacterium]|nr:hypothetical protein [Ktedonobacteraceae bacterium]